MFNRKNEQGKRQQVFMSSVEALANLLAVLATFFITPEVFARTAGFVVHYASTRYGSGLEEVTAIVWFVLTGLLAFFTSRASVSTAVVALGLAIAVRFV